MASYKNFQSKNKKHEKDRYDIYEPDFATPIEHNENSNIISRNIKKWTEFCAFIR